MELKRNHLSLLKDSLLGCSLRRALRFLPGIGLSLSVVLASVVVADWANGAWGFRGMVSHIMMAIMLGIIVRNTVGVPSGTADGLSFCIRKLLRLGIIMMGIRLSIFDAVRIGAWALPIVLVSIFTGLVITTYFSRLLRLSHRLGTLIAVGTGICGATAIVAIAPVVEAKDEEVSYAVANITLFGILAMLLYPYLSHLIFRGNVTLAGLFTGTAIHETAQVIGAGLIYDQVFDVTSRPSVADVAIIVKLLRNGFIFLVIPMMALIYGRQRSKEDAEERRLSTWSLFPQFLVGFVALAAIRSAGDAAIEATSQVMMLDVQAWRAIIEAVSVSSGYALAAAMAGVGLGTSLTALRGIGFRPFYVGLLAAVLVGLASILAIMGLRAFINF